MLRVVAAAVVLFYEIESMGIVARDERAKDTLPTEGFCFLLARLKFCPVLIGRLPFGWQKYNVKRIRLARCGCASSPSGDVLGQFLHVANPSRL